jgi:hypothetical protein
MKPDQITKLARNTFVSVLMATVLLGQSAIGADLYAVATTHVPAALEKQSTSALVTDLLQAINRISTYSPPTEVPAVAHVSRDELERLACGGACALVKAAYLPDRGIYLDERLDPRNNLIDRSILLHELVHHLQAMTGRYRELGDCERRQEEEAEAFAIQNAYLAAMGSAITIPFPSYVYRCD